MTFCIIIQSIQYGQNSLGTITYIFITKRNKLCKDVYIIVSEKNKFKKCDITSFTLIQAYAKYSLQRERILKCII